MLLPLADAVSRRTVRRYVAALLRPVRSKEAFVHRSVLPGTTMEVDSSSRSACVANGRLGHGERGPDGAGALPARGEAGDEGMIRAVEVRMLPALAIEAQPSAGDAPRQRRREGL